MEKHIRSVWQVCREYAGIAEAGGVKNVVCSLSEALVRSGITVTVFMPFYGCIDKTLWKSAPPVPVISGEIEIACVLYQISFLKYSLNGVDILLIDTPIFREKQSVYTYTLSEEKTVHGAFRGKGHNDVDILNLVLQRAVLYFAGACGSAPDVLHCQDAHTALLPAFIRTDASYREQFIETVMIVTIHNAGPGYRQTIHSLERARALTGLPVEVLREAMLGETFEPFLLAAKFSLLSTVSPWYANELIDPATKDKTGGLSLEFKRRGTRIVGITNGIDYARYDPRNTAVSLLPFAFDPQVPELSGKYRCRDRLLSLINQAALHIETLTYFGSLVPAPDAVYFVYHGRIARQKGLSVLVQAATDVLARSTHSRFIITGQGDPDLEEIIEKLAVQHPGRVAFIRGYDRSVARLCVASSDFLVLPSIFEPCGLEDLIGQIFGTIPVAHAVGGLNKIQHRRTGYLYRDKKDDGRSLVRLLLVLSAKLSAARAKGAAISPPCLCMIKAAAVNVTETFSWDKIVYTHYLPLYSEKTCSE